MSYTTMNYIQNTHRPHNENTQTFEKCRTENVTALLVNILITQPFHPGGVLVFLTLKVTNVTVTCDWFPAKLAPCRSRSHFVRCVEIDVKTVHYLNYMNLNTGLCLLKLCLLRSEMVF